MGEIGDRMAIHDLLARYCHRIDQHQWAELRSLFTDRAEVDFRAFGGPQGDADTLIAFLRPIVEGLARTHHMTSTIVCDLDGNRAVVRSTGHVTMVSAAPDGTESNHACGLWYEDVVVREQGRWLFQHRTQQRGWASTSAAGRSDAP